MKELEPELLAFLRGTDAEFILPDGARISRAQARLLVQELIPAHIDVRDVCTLPAAAVAAAPHAGFDNWAEYFCNRAARALGLGRVLAFNYRDQDSRTIPAAIGRHLHVNRPTESERPRGAERETDRARAAYAEYVAALKQAGGARELPLDLLIEFHSQRRTPLLEIATVGVSADFARALEVVYIQQRAADPVLPALAIEPLHPLTLTAAPTKHSGSLRPEIARCALHIEVPRGMRRDAGSRVRVNTALIALLQAALEQVLQRRK